MELNEAIESAEMPKLISDNMLPSDTSKKSTVVQQVANVAIIKDSTMLNGNSFKQKPISKNQSTKTSPKKDETKVGINPIEGIGEMDAHLRSQMTFVFFCCSSFVMLIVYIGECKT